MKPLRIAMVAPAVFPVRGGVEAHVHHLAQQLTTLGHHVTVLTRKSVPHVARSYALHDSLSVTALAGKILRGGFDVVHAHGARDPFAAAALLVARGAGLRTCFTPHCFYPASDLAGRWKRVLFDASAGYMSLDGTDVVICLTKTGMEEALRQPGVHAERLHIVPNCITLPVETDTVLTNRLRSEYGPFLLCVGRMDRVKRGDFLIRSLPLLAEDLRLVFVGADAGACDAWRAVAAEEQLSHRVVFLNDASDEILMAAYRACVALVMASAQEGLPTVLLEAMALGTPVIACNRGGITDLITHNVNGQIYPYEHATAFASCVNHVLHGDTERMRQVAQTMVREHYTWETAAPYLARLYR